MASLTLLCTESSLKLKSYKLLLPLLNLMKYPPTVVLNLKFADRALKFAIPTECLDAALNNAEHVIVDCDYYKLSRAVPRSGDTVVDAGAFLGFYTATSSILAGKEGQVYAIEPNPNIAGFLSLNLELNHVKNTSIYPVAICPERGWARLYVGEYSSVSSLLREHVEKYTRVTGVREVKCIRLSSLLSYLGSVDVLKLDIEGMELEVLSEAFEQLKRVENLVIEVHKDIVDPRDVENLLFKSGFRKVVTYVLHELPWQLVVYAFKV